MKRTILFLFSLCVAWAVDAVGANRFPRISEQAQTDYFPLSTAAVYTDADDYPVVNIAAGMLVDDVERVTGVRPAMQSATNIRRLPVQPVVVAGTKGHSLAQHPSQSVRSSAVAHLSARPRHCITRVVDSFFKIS